MSNLLRWFTSIATLINSCKVVIFKSPFAADPFMVTHEKTYISLPFRMNDPLSLLKISTIELIYCKFLCTNVKGKILFGLD